jgi:hypothetical protein
MGLLSVVFVRRGGGGGGGGGDMGGYLFYIIPVISVSDIEVLKRTNKWFYWFGRYQERRARYDHVLRDECMCVLCVDVIRYALK